MKAGRKYRAFQRKVHQAIGVSTSRGCMCDRGKTFKKLEKLMKRLKRLSRELEK